MRVSQLSHFSAASRRRIQLGNSALLFVKTPVVAKQSMPVEPRPNGGASGAMKLGSSGSIDDQCKRENLATWQNCGSPNEFGHAHLYRFKNALEHKV
jgi:hypothetical protein